MTCRGEGTGEGGGSETGPTRGGTFMTKKWKKYIVLGEVKSFGTSFGWRCSFLRVYLEMCVRLGRGNGCKGTITKTDLNLSREKPKFSVFG